MTTSESKPNLREYLDSLGANEGYGEELYRLFLANPAAVPEDWRQIFAGLAPGGGTGGGTERPTADATPPAGLAPAINNGHAAPAAATGPAAPAVALQAGDVADPLRGAAARLVANMESSLSVPTATSQRTVAVRLLEENRRLANQHLAARGGKLAMTPIISWAVVQAALEFPNLNSALTRVDGQPARVTRGHVNLGLAVDVERAAGRSLLVPVVKAAESLGFADFAAACERLIAAARSGKIAPDDLMGATLSLTNPGTIGTRASVPRLMAGQAAIVATGAIAYPAGFEGVAEATLRILGVGKSFTLSCTYDHRLVQGAESGAFLARVDALLGGADGFYEKIFQAMGVGAAPFHGAAAAETATSGGADFEPVRKQAAVFQLVHAFRVRGHLQAAVDPLEMKPLTAHPELDPGHYGLTVWDLDRRFLCPLAGSEKNGDGTCTLRDILEVLRATYCGSLACEFMHLQRPEERAWLQEQMEPNRNHPAMGAERQRRILHKLVEAESFEHLLHARFVGHKRFSLEGGEALIPALDQLLNQMAGDGASEVVLGMSHRGRLNVLVTILGLGMNEMFSKFEDLDPESVDGSGDVKYHIGARGRHVAPDGRELAIDLIPNPSHLEAVDPVVEGSTRGRQAQLRDQGQRIIPLLIHGDAAFAGQGVVVETLNLSQLDGYRTGGTCHLVVNNQIGFTTSPAGARSSLYCTDVARTVQAPIFHVNGDDPEAVVRACELAFAFRQKFQKDVVVDVVCYRRHGHNEADDPSLTAPVLYRKIEQHASVRSLYGAALVRRGSLSAEEDAALTATVKEQLSAAAAQPPASPAAAAVAPVALPASAVELGTLAAIGERLCASPADFTLHPKLRAFIEKRRQASAGAAAVDWSLAEALALGALALQGVPIRLTGQDTGRGTFSQRHAVLYDFQQGSPYIPLAHLSAGQEPVEIFDSLLSEEAALGFEFGYAMRRPDVLVLWEAQFGDFVNGAQVVIDQFLCCSQTKWGRTSGLTLLLPHGYEGQGPEHSSARIERFLQLSAEDNWRIANCTTAAQYFHLLRQQGLAGLGTTRRPLVVFTPKSLLRHPGVASPVAALSQGTFAPVLDDAAARGAERVVFCSGKIYYDLLKARGTAATVALVRLEQLYPFPATEIAAVLQALPGARSFCWAQEEPANMGALRFIRPQLQALLPAGAVCEAIARPESASPAAGSLRRHQQEQASLVEKALRLPAGQ